MSALTRWAGHRNRMALAAGVVGAAALALGTTASLGGFSASITNTGDQVNTGTLIMQEQVTPTGGTTTACLSTAAGATINTNAANCNANKFGAITNGVPGSTSFSTVVVTNQGSVTANTFSLGAGTCAITQTAGTGAQATNYGSDIAAGTAGYCGKLDLTIEDDTVAATPKCVYPASALACATPTNANTVASFAATYPLLTPLALTTPVPAAPATGSARTYKVTVLVDPTAATNADQGLGLNLPLTFTFGS